MIKGLVSRIALLASWLGVIAVPAQAADFASFNANYGRNVVAPAFKSLAGETKKLAQAADVTLLNEMPFGPWTSRDAAFDVRLAVESIEAHDSAFPALRALPGAVISSRPFI